MYAKERQGFLFLHYSRERDMEELLLGSIFYCCQIGGKSRTADSDQMAPIYTRQTWTRNIVGILPVNILGFTHNILEASLRKQWSKVENMRTTFALDDVAYSVDFHHFCRFSPFFVDFHHFLSIFTIYALLSRFTFCRDLRTFSANFFGQNSLLRNITGFFACMGQVSFQ